MEPETLATTMEPKARPTTSGPETVLFSTMAPDVLATTTEPGALATTIEPEALATTTALPTAPPGLCESSEALLCLERCASCAGCTAPPPVFPIPTPRSNLAFLRTSSHLIS